MTDVAHTVNISQPFSFGSSPAPSKTNSQLVAPKSSAFVFQFRTPDELHTWARGLYRETYCDENGDQNRPMRIDELLEALQREKPSEQKAIEELQDSMNFAISIAICKRFATKPDGKFVDQVDAIITLQEMRPDLAEDGTVSEMISRIESANYRMIQREQKTNVEPQLVTPNKPACSSSLVRATAPHPMTVNPSQIIVSESKSLSASAIGIAAQTRIHAHAQTEATSRPEVILTPATIQKPIMPQPATIPGSALDSFEEWVHQFYLNEAFEKNGSFKGYIWMKEHLVRLRPAGEKSQIIQTVNKLRKPGHKLSFDVNRDIKAKIPPRSAQINCGGRRTELQNFDLLWESHPMAQPINSVSSSTHFTYPDEAVNTNIPPQDDLLARQLRQIQPREKHSADSNKTGGANISETSDTFDMKSLLTNDSGGKDDNGKMVDELDIEIQHAPLLSESAFSKNNRDTVPQFGLLGSHEKEMLFLNTNIPFSAFICGVQGSGKSHTTACIMKNALIPSKQLGRLEKPLSALVFSYGQFGGDGSGFSISEASFLGAPHPNYPGHTHVKKVHVLVSPSNYVKISKLYLRVPNVSVSKFKIKPQNLDIEVMLTLMNVNESDDTPLYMAAVTQILRQMATEGLSFDYLTFKAKLRKCHFNPVQINMLQMRLGLLESFLDLDNSCPAPQFKAGEITIMDMSCPFVDANTACIMFRIGLQRYLQSKAAGKMVVLDEAHKYMLPNTGAKALNEALLTTIRLQRHYGARLVISTQEPTLLTDLIALCSVTVIHRFSSPEWFAAIKRHIPMKPEEHHKVMSAIESLKTGTALVYSPTSVYGKDKEGKLVKGVGRFLELKVRKRVTNDGGQSVLAV